MIMTQVDLWQTALVLLVDFAVNWLGWYAQFFAWRSLQHRVQLNLDAFILQTVFELAQVGLDRTDR
jgi:hypothetical protein